MAETAGNLEGPDFAMGCEIEKLANGAVLLGHVFGEAILAARRGGKFLPLVQFAHITAAHWRKA